MVLHFKMVTQKSQIMSIDLTFIWIGMVTYLLQRRHMNTSLISQKCECYNECAKADRIRNERIRGTTKVGEVLKKSPGKKDEMVWACDEKRVGCVGRR